MSFPQVEGVTFRYVAELGGYAVGSDGSVWSSHAKGKGRDRRTGWHRVSIYRRPYGGRYCVVSLRENAGKGRVVCRYVHRLVLEAFVGPCPEGMEGCHNDGNSANNRLGNLRWDTHKANGDDQDRHGTRPQGTGHKNSKLNPEKVREIRRLHANGTTQKEIGERFGVSPSVIRSVLYRMTWKHVA